MSILRKYRRREETPVTAVQLNLDTTGFTYLKWGGTQTASAGDWLVNRDGEAYTVAQDVFERTYVRISPGVYEKHTPVWACTADTDGAIDTREGVTDFKRGDIVVYNDPAQSDGYAMSRETFEALYVAVDE